MVKELVVDVGSMVVWYHPDLAIVHHEMRRYPGADALQSARERGLEALQRNRASKWLSDDRLGGALPESHHQWAQHVWGPKAAAAGWKHWALLPPAELVGGANMMRLAEVYNALGVTVGTFSTPEDALAWLIAR
jgi:hypothetical protein